MGVISRITSCPFEYIVNPLEAFIERATTAKKIAHLSRSILVGFFFYSVAINFGDPLLMRLSPMTGGILFCVAFFLQSCVDTGLTILRLERHLGERLPERSFFNQQVGRRF